MKQKHFAFLIVAVVILCVAYIVPLSKLYTLARSSDSYTHLLLIPFLSLFFLFHHRKSLYLSTGFFPVPTAIAMILGGVLLLVSFQLPPEYPIVHLDIRILSFLFMIGGCTVFLFGMPVIISTPFPWMLLLLMLPFPTIVLDGIIDFFRVGSAEVVDLLMQVAGVNYIRDKLTFHLPTLSIFIAKECSGIRSSTALFITGLLAGHLTLRTWWGKSLFILAVIPLTFIKNGIRITALTLLAVKFDHAWLDGSLHHKGGIVFFGLILLLFFALLFLIQKLERTWMNHHHEVHEV